MGRLFWKFLFTFWLTLLIAGVSVGVTVWLHKPAGGPDARFMPPPRLDHAPPRPGAPPWDAPGRPHGPPPGPPGGPWLPIGAGLLASLAFSALLAWYVAKPIRKLRGALRDVAAGRLETRVMQDMDGRRDELADLGRDFDAMAQQIDGLVGAQRRLFHDVSHELRSPLARLQAAIGLARRSPERVDAMLDRLETEAARLDELVGEILTLARLDSGSGMTRSEVFDVMALLEAVVEDARFEAQARGCDLAYRGGAHAACKGQPDLIGRAFENVIRNAIKYTNEETMVEVESRLDAAGNIHVVVLDRGPGVSDSDLEAIFEPFYRGRQLGESVGFGLGLAIAKRAVTAHGGQVSAVYRQGGGLRVEIELPTA